jgi:hypothetical protein
VSAIVAQLNRVIGSLQASGARLLTLRHPDEAERATACVSALRKQVESDRAARLIAAPPEEKP